MVQYYLMNANFRQTFLNTPADCKWVRETHLKPSNLNNGPLPEFNSFCLFGNEDCPNQILAYFHAHPMVNDKGVRFMLMDNGRYSMMA
jgi:hypothetical protein